MSEPSKTRPLWIAIGVLSVALVGTLVVLVTRDADPGQSKCVPAPAEETPPAATPAPTEKGGGDASPFAADPKETEARERLMVISRGLDEHFKQRYAFPDRLEVLVAAGLILPKDLQDPWGRAVDYTLVAKARFKLCSRGPDAASYTDDDVCIGPGGREERPGR
ncbi:MAG: hypothetical protein IT385_13000 [Deltaproteobacteria bacterium]|nr:hypothetical protein [Deltaproteobacteria bacterium]